MNSESRKIRSETYPVPNPEVVRTEREPSFSRTKLYNKMESSLTERVEVTSIAFTNRFSF